MTDFHFQPFLPMRKQCRGRALPNTKDLSATWRRQKHIFFCHLRVLSPSVSCEILWFGFSKIRIQKQALYSPNPSPSKKCQAVFDEKPTFCFLMWACLVCSKYVLKDSPNSISSKSSSDLNISEVRAIDNEVKTALSDTQTHDKILAFIAQIKWLWILIHIRACDVRHEHITQCLCYRHHDGMAKNNHFFKPQTIISNLNIWGTAD